MEREREREKEREDGLKIPTGGVLESGEFLINNRAFLSYTILVPAQRL